MSSNYSRPLNTLDCAQHFITSVLEITDEDLQGRRVKNTSLLAKKIMTAEVVIANIGKETTLTSKTNRFDKYKTDAARKKLRKEIFIELFSAERLDDDEQITLGKGGAKPKSPPQSKKTAFIVTGLPASGKSTIINTLSDNIGAFVIDSDYAKRKLPEFDCDDGANLVHDESQLITMGMPSTPYEHEPNLMDYCISKGFNMIIPKIGYTHKGVEKLRDYLNKLGYEVHLTLVSLERQKSTRRALFRYLDTDRYVPLSLIFDCYANDPILSYHRTKGCTAWSSSGKISTDVDVNEMPAFIEGTKNNPSLMFK